MTEQVHRAAIRHSAFSSDGELIAIAGDDPFIIIVSHCRFPDYTCTDGADFGVYQAGHREGPGDWRGTLSGMASDPKLAGLLHQSQRFDMVYDTPGVAVCILNPSPRRAVLASRMR